MSNDLPPEDETPQDEPSGNDLPSADGQSGDGGGPVIPPTAIAVPGDSRIRNLDIRQEMQTSYLTYAMSVIVSRALPDARDGLKPAQRRILVAMNDLNLGPNSGRIKCAKISGDTSGNYHPHGEGSVYPTLVRMAQSWVMRQTLIDPQGNFGSLAGLGPAAMRYTEARLSAVASEMMRDLDRNTVDFTNTYDNRNTEPVVLPSKFPNLLVNGSSGIAVGMRTEIPPHNLDEVCDAVVTMIDNPEATVDDILDVMPGPDFPTGGVICGRLGIRQAYQTGRSKLILRARTHYETEKKRDVIVVTEIPYTTNRDGIREQLEDLVRRDRVKGIARIVDLTDRTIPPWQVRLHIELRTDADKEVVLNQLFKHSSLQKTVSLIFLALVGNRPETLPITGLLKQFIRHRVTVIRRRTEFLLDEARRRKHIVEGLLFAQLNIDLIIQTIRDSPSREVAKQRLREIPVPPEMVRRALGEAGFEEYVREQGEAEDGNYSLSQKQSEAIVAMQLGSLANLERDQLGDEHRGLLENIGEYISLLSDESNILAVVREDMLELKTRYGDKRRSEINDDELTDIDREELITEEPMVVTISQRGYIKRTQLTDYRAQHRGGKGIKGAKSDEEDPIEHLFVSSTHSYLLFFTDRGQVYWQKVYDLPLQGRTAKGRALINLLRLQDSSESVATCIPIREFSDDHYLAMVTRRGLVKKTALSAYSRPMRGGIIAINLDDDDELITVRVVSGDDDLLLSTRQGMSIRFHHADARAMGRNTRGVKGINLTEGDEVVGMVVAEPGRDLLTLCEHGFGKRTPFGDPNPSEDEGEELDDETEADADPADGESEAEAETIIRSGAMYRRQKRGGKGIRDIRATDRNGPVMGILSVLDTDDILMVTAEGKIQRIRAADIRRIGRNTQGVRLMSLGDSDLLVSCARIPAEEDIEQEAATLPTTPKPPVIEAEPTNGTVNGNESNGDG